MIGWWVLAVFGVALVYGGSAGVIISDAVERRAVLSPVVDAIPYAILRIHSAIYSY